MRNREYALVNTSRGGFGAAVVLLIVMLFSAAILVAAVFLSIQLVAEAGNDIAPPPPPPIPIPQISVPLRSTLQMSLLFMEAQKSGGLPQSYPFTWRNNSGTYDGANQNKNLSGGFYDGGGTMKYTYPTAFSITMLCWSVIEYNEVYVADGSLEEAISLIQWGVDYLLSATYSNVVFAQVGVVETDENCWIRPEDMSAKQRPTQFPCDPTHPCSDLAGEMAAALAAASIVFNDPVGGNPAYSLQVSNVAEALFSFADTYRGSYSDWLTNSNYDYNSTGYTDELFWAATWLYYATGDESYGTYISNSENIANYLEDPYKTPQVFNWDHKSAGVQVLVTRLITMGYGIDQITNSSSPASLLANYLNVAKSFVCQYMPQNTLKANFTKVGSGSGLMWAGETNATIDRPIEYAINTAFLATLLVDYLWPALNLNATNPATFYSNCNAQLSDIINFALSQQRYILGYNPLKLSYMVGYNGYGSRYPLNVYHKASSIPSSLVDSTKYDCLSGRQWLLSSSANPNILYGAVVGGPTINDFYADKRDLRSQSEPKTHMNAVWAGLISALSSGTTRPGIVQYTRMWVNLPFAYEKAQYIQDRLPKHSPPPPNAKTPIQPGAPVELVPPAGPLSPIGAQSPPPPA